MKEIKIRWEIKVEQKNFEWDGACPHWKATNSYDNRACFGHSVEEAKQNLNHWLEKIYNNSKEIVMEKIFCQDCKYYSEKVFSPSIDAEDEPYCEKCIDSPIAPESEEIGTNLYKQNANNNCPYYEGK